MKTYSLIISIMFISIISFAQNKVLTTDGKLLNASSFQVTKESVSMIVGGESQSLPKSNILCIIPDGKQGYTYRIKNGQKLKIRKRYIHHNYQGTDKPRIYAHKYLGSQSDIEQIYIKNSDTSISYEEFKTIFKKQQKNLKTNNIIGTSATVFLLLITFSIGTS